MKNKLLFQLCLATQLGFSFCFATTASDVQETPTIVVSCATGELGGAIAELLAPQNNLILTGRNLEKLKKLQSDFQSQYKMHYEIQTVDYENKKNVADFKDTLAAKVESITGFVVLQPRPHLGTNLMPEEAEWLQLFQCTFTGPLETLKAAIPKLSKNSKIVVIAGTTSVQLQPEYGSACVIRRMWSTYAKALAHQLGPKGVRVNVLSPGVVLTDFHKEKTMKKAEKNGCSYDEQMTKDVAQIPMRRYAKAEEVAQAVQFLLSDASSYITGNNIVIDGGVTTSY